MAAPTVYAAINAVSAALAKSGIAKTHLNQIDDYRYRSIDDLLDRLGPLLAEHRLCVLPRALEREVVERSDEGRRLLLHVALRVAFTLTSVEDGSSHVVEAFGEALDVSDKATAKAMSAAYKSAMVQTFCIPLSGTEDADRTSPKLTSRTHVAEPVQGWEQWVNDIEDIVSVCETEQAIAIVQERNRELLKSLSRERADLYQQLGQALNSRRQTILWDQASARTRTPGKRRRSERPRPAITAKERETPDV
jgi:hypothetical protein